MNDAATPRPRSGVMHWSDRLLMSGLLFGAAMQAARLGDTLLVYVATTGGILSLILIGCDCLSAYARSEATAKGKT